MDDSIVARSLERELINNRYRPRRLLGRGGMGWTLAAEDLLLNRQTVVLKFLYPHLLGNEASLRRFRNEVLYARRLVHPHIVRTYHFSTDPLLGHNIIMEFVPGSSLRTVLAEARGPELPLHEAARYLLQIVSSIEYAHSMGIIHLDIKPENVLFDGVGQLKLADFGLAQPLREQNGRPGQLVGTPTYMAPEQFKGIALEKATDIYSLGILGYELFAGEPPYSGSSLYNLAQHHLHDPLPSVRRARKEFPAELDGALQRCCEKAPADRLRHLGDLSRILLSCFPELEKTPPITAPPRNDRLPPRIIRTALLLWGSKRFRRAILLFAFLLVVFYGRRDGLLRDELTYLTLRAEQSLERPIPGLRGLFRITATRQRSLVEATIDYAELKSRLRFGENPNVTDDSGRSPLTTAVESGLPERVSRLLLRFGAHPNFRDSHGRTVFHVLVGSRDLGLAKTLLAQGGDVNLMDQRGDTALLLAVRRRDFPLIRFLLAAGANPDLPNHQGDTARSEATRLGEKRVIDLFDISPRQSRDHSAQH